MSSTHPFAQTFVGAVLVAVTGGLIVWRVQVYSGDPANPVVDATTSHPTATMVTTSRPAILPVSTAPVLAPAEPATTGPVPLFRIRARNPSTISHDGRLLECYSSIIPSRRGVVLCPNRLRTFRDTLVLSFIAAPIDDRAATGRVSTTLTDLQWTLVDHHARRWSGVFRGGLLDLYPGEHRTVEVRIAGAAEALKGELVKFDTFIEGTREGHPTRFQIDASVP